MSKIDTEILEQFNYQLNALVSDMEENWYLIKHLLNEMDIEELYTNYNVDNELKSVYQKLEILVDRFNGMKQITKTIPSDYEEILSRHINQISLMGEYAQGLKHTYQSISDMSRKERIDVINANTAPIRYAIEEFYGIEGVIKDE